MLEQRRKRVGSIVGASVIAVLLASALFVTYNRQFILDTINFWSFTAPETIVTIKNRAMLSDSGTFLFYSTRPEVQLNQAFNSSCNRKEQNVAVIGCYANNRIYIYDVTDKRLDGIKEVTAAHELLHAVYQRLSDGERAEVDGLIESEYSKLVSDPDLADRMAFYARTEPGERNNELFSIIGTEVMTIDQKLENYYSKYFSNRKIIVELYNGYNQAFTDLDKKTSTLSSQLDTLSKRIDEQMIQYNSEVSQLSSDIDSFNKRATEGDFLSQAAFNSERQILQNRVTNLDKLRQTIMIEVDQYEKIRNEYNDTVIQNNQLYQSIDSKLKTAPSV